MNSDNLIISEIKNNIENINKLLPLLSDPKLKTQNYNIADSVFQEHEDRKNMFNIHLAIDHVDDIFDDFDDEPSVIETRTLSDDFIDAINIRYKYSLKKLAVYLIFKPVFRHHIQERVIISTIKEQIRLKKRDVVFGFLFKMALSFCYFMIGIFTLLNLALFQKMITEVLLLNNRFYHELIMILGWVGVWEGITRTVDIFTMDLKKFLFYSKLSKAVFMFRFK